MLLYAAIPEDYHLIIPSMRLDRRKLNHGAPTRKSYSKEVKRRSIALRDSGLSVDEIAKILDTAKSNVEKWCSAKVSTYSYTIVYLTLRT